MANYRRHAEALIGMQTWLSVSFRLFSFGCLRHHAVGIKAAGWMLKVKDTLRATVNLTFDGQVIKTYHGSDALKRFENEVQVLNYLEAQGCPFVPRLLEANREKLRIITTNCGSRVERVDPDRVRELFAELQQYGVRHDDPDVRNITYRQQDGRFCLIDFEFATILSDASRTKPQ